MDTTNLPQAVTPNDKTMGMLSHLSGLAGYIIPFGNIIGPLVMYLVHKDKSPFVTDQAKEALNFQITMTILIIICLILMIVIIGLLLLPVVGILDLIFTIIGAVKANSGVAYRYPFALRLVK